MCDNFQQQMNVGFVKEIGNVFRVFVTKIDGYQCIGVSVMSSEVNDQDWKNVKNLITHYLKLIYEHKIKYHFIFDVHEIPVQRLASFQSLMKRNQHILNECLYSTAIITKNSVLHYAMQLALEVYTPVCPIQFFYKEPTDTKPSKELDFIPSKVMHEVLQYYKSTRNSN